MKTNSNLVYTPEEFSEYIQLKAKEKGCDVSDLLVEMLENSTIDIEDIKKLMTPTIKGKIKKEYIDSGVIHSKFSTNDIEDLL